MVLAVLLSALIGVCPAQEDTFAPGRVIVRLDAKANQAQAMQRVEATTMFRFASGAELWAVEDIYTALPALWDDPDVVYAEPDWTLSIAGTVAPNDPYYSQQYGLAKIQVEAAWSIERGSRSIVVAITDTGIDHTHPDLADQLWVNSGETLDGIDNDGNGYVDDVRGWDFIGQGPDPAGDNDPYDDNRHGTHVAGIVAATTGNSIGMSGIADVTLMPLKFLSCGGSGSTSDAIRAIDYAVANGANVINASWGGGAFSQALEDSLHAASQAGVLFIASAGNSGRDTDLTPFYPQGYALSNIISVAASDPNDLMPAWSNFGAKTVDLAAPGVDILSAYRVRVIPINPYVLLSGTSMAAPHVAGVAALILSRNPGLSPLNVKNIILSTVDRLPAFAAPTPVASGGRLNANAALRLTWR